MLRVIGLNHHSASLDIRECFALSPKQIADALAVWNDTNADTEAVLLSTCNRTELYMNGQNSTPPNLSALFPANNCQLSTLSFQLDNSAAVEHLFSVTAGLDSMVLGDMQISSQVRAAYQLALKAETVGTILHGLFQTAFKTAKRVAAETDLHKHKTSIPSIAVSELALRIFDTLTDKNILVFGAGEMSHETVKYLADTGAKHITIFNRNRKRAEALVSEGVVVADWDDRFTAMRTADIVVSATSSPEPILTLADYIEIEKHRFNSPLFLLDLAVPRDIAPSIGERAGIYLYSLDDLQAICERNRLERNKAIPKAEQIIRAAVREYEHDVNRRKSGAVIQQLRQRWAGTKETELQRLFNKLPELSEKQRSEIAYTMERLTAKFLHPPMESLRSESLDGDQNSLLTVLAKLFKLE